MERAIEDIAEWLRREVGEERACLYRCGATGPPEQAGATLLAVVADDVDLLALRELFLPVWAEHGAALRRPPAVAHAHAVARHGRLVPVFAAMLDEEGRRLWGALPLDGPAPELSSLAWLAYLAHEAMAGSAALAPELLTAAEAEDAYGRLLSVSQRLEASAFSGRPPAATLFARIQIRLRERIAEALGHDEPNMITDPAAPNLHGVYTTTDRVVVLLPPLSEPLLLDLDWKALAERVAVQHNMLEATAAQQLVLIQEHETPLAFALGRYHHLWGIAPLADLRVSLGAVLQSAGRDPSQLLVEGLGGDYLTAAGDEALHMILHDYQNRLLNLRLQHELLHRLHGLEPAEPPVPLPPRGAPFDQRLGGVMEHLDWWAAHYTALWEQAPAGARIAPL